MRIEIAALPTALLLAGALACGGGGDNAGDEKDVPGVDASGTADTEIFTDSPDTVGVPVAGQGGTVADSTQPGGGGAGASGTTAAPGQPASTGTP
jgi:hypothetical protein